MTWGVLAKLILPFDPFIGWFFKSTTPLNKLENEKIFTQIKINRVWLHNIERNRVPALQFQLFPFLIQGTKGYNRGKG